MPSVRLYLCANSPAMAAMKFPYFLLAFLVMMQSRRTYGLASDFRFFLNLIDDDRNTWIDTHNYYRRLVSGPEAANMKLMTWDDGLEAFARNVVSTCSFHHTASVNLSTDDFSTVGENLYAGGEYRFSQMTARDGVTKQWYDENAYYTYSTATCQSGRECGHYTQVIWATTYKVGCAIARCSAIEGGNTPYLISCNYGPAGNVYSADGIPRKPYIEGDACTQCDAGDDCTDQLCSNDVRDLGLNATETTTTAVTVAEVTTAVTTPTVVVTTVALDDNVTATTNATAGARSWREVANLNLLPISWTLLYYFKIP